MKFKDREEAALKLSERLQRMDLENPLLLAIPRGGVPMGKVIADRLKADLDIILVKKVGHPWNPEFAVASVTEEGELILGEGAEQYGFSPEDLADKARKTALSLQERRQRYAQGRVPLDPKGRNVVLIDDGIATGMTVIAAIQDLRNKGAHEILVATPVASRQAVQKIQETGTKVIALALPESFISVSQIYQDFYEVSDEDVIDLLEKSSKGEPHVSF